jgi:hypothetical protein
MVALRLLAPSYCVGVIAAASRSRRCNPAAEFLAVPNMTLRLPLAIFVRWWWWGRHACLCAFCARETLRRQRKQHYDGVCLPSIPLFFFYSGSCRSHIHASRVLLLFVDVGVVSSIPYEIATPVSCFLAVVLEAAQLCLSFFLNSFSFRKGDRFDTPSLTPLTPFSIHHSSVSPRPHHYYHYCTFSHKSPIILI